VHGALGQIGAHSAIKPANPTSMQTGVDMLNGMIARWMDDGIDFGAVPLETEGSELSEPLGLTNTIIFNLGIELHPFFPGSQISPQLRTNAGTTYQDMLTKSQVITIPKPIPRDTLPRGQGNHRNRHVATTFFDKDDTLG
jgi:hypothetical protein